MDNPKTKKSAKIKVRFRLGDSLKPATMLIMRGIMAKTQGLEAVKSPPTKTATGASQGLCLEDLGNISEELVHFSTLVLFHAFFLQHFQDFFFGEKADMSGEFLAIFVKEDLSRDESNAVFSGRGGIFPNVIKNHLDVIGKLFGNFLDDRLHLPAGNAGVSADLKKSHFEFGKIQFPVIRNDDPFRRRLLTRMLSTSALSCSILTRAEKQEN